MSVQTIDLPALQRRVVENKKRQGFNITDMHQEFNYLQMELAEAIEAYIKKQPHLGEELADIAIYLLGIAEIQGIDLGAQILAKVEKNEQRKYVHEGGVTRRVD
ncbi:MAG: hypothetical protein FWC16_08955 [Defluviitaleaceae bacterium]|nr:hypothetical protein [Defluviitaleaceae bacterium]MCL2275038.1 hypothetical protein [Defluviitaleaceae bacterium]